VVNAVSATLAADPCRALGLREALQALAGGHTTATVLMKQSLDRAEACKRSLNAFAAIDWDRALKAAADSDRRYAEGRPRPLEGLPIGVKDLIDTRGIETRYGSAAYVGNVPDRDADVVRQLAEGGAIVVGKTTTHEFAWGVTTASAAFGDTLNPLDRARIPGGSSGGAAAAIGGGAVAAGLGTDTGGSVRIPAALCGVVGFKPTFGALSTQGVFPLAPSLDHPGLLGRRVDDVAVLAGAFGIEVPDNDAWMSARLGVVREIAPVPLAAQVARAFDGAVATLAGNLAVEPLAVGQLFDGVYAAFARIVLTEAGVEHFRRNDWQRIVAHYEAQTVERLELAKGMSLGEYAKAQEARRAFAARLRDAMAHVDYLVLPTCPCIAPHSNESTLLVGGGGGPVREALMTYTAPFNVAGFPAISLPLPVDGSVLPAALQIVAHPGDDGALLQIAQLVESMLQGGPDEKY
jgi:aspartyl-tRNA(Asn)/glutamyl-tRNA(Gln) amidotransferase subunit A